MSEDSMSPNNILISSTTAVTRNPNNSENANVRISQYKGAGTQSKYMTAGDYPKILLVKKAGKRKSEIEKKWEERKRTKMRKESQRDCERV